jgi:AraC-like DNA-binding protein
MKKLQKITLAEIMPLIRGANYTKVARLQFGPRCNYASQFFYLVKGSVNVEINEMKYNMNPGDFILYGPYDIHCLTSIGTEQVIFSTVNFSWNHDVAVNLHVANQTVPYPDEDYLKKADIKVIIDDLPVLPFLLHIPECNRNMLEKLLLEIGNNFRNSDELARLRLTGLLMEVFHIIITVKNDPEALRPMTWVQRFNSYLDENFADTALDRKHVSKALGISESYLTALLRKHLHSNFTNCLTSVRMSKAVEMLTYSDMSIKEVANFAGFSNYSYFVSRFRQVYKRTPGELSRRSDMNFW